MLVASRGCQAFKKVIKGDTKGKCEQTGGKKTNLNCAEAIKEQNNRLLRTVLSSKQTGTLLKRMQAGHSFVVTVVFLPTCKVEEGTWQRSERTGQSSERTWQRSEKTTTHL